MLKFINTTGKIFDGVDQEEMTGNEAIFVGIESMQNPITEDEIEYGLDGFFSFHGTMGGPRSDNIGPNTPSGEAARIKELKPLEFHLTFYSPIRMDGIFIKTMSIRQIIKDAFCCDGGIEYELEEDAQKTITGLRELATELEILLNNTEREL